MRTFRLTLFGLVLLLMPGCNLTALLESGGLGNLNPGSNDDAGTTGGATFTPIENDFACATADTPCDVQRALYWINQTFGVIRNTWEGKYHFDAWPLYVVYVDAQNKASGYIVNGQNLPAGATAVTGAAAQGLTVHRYDGRASAASGTENGLYDLLFDINGTEYSMILLKPGDADDIESGNYQWVMTLVHETFHAYQIKDWQSPAGMLQDEENYPITAEVLALSLLECKIASAAYKTDNAADAEKYLKMYIAARTEKIRIDPSGEKLVLNMDNPQEHGEGTARYIEFKFMELLEPTVPDVYFKAYLDDVLETGFDSAEGVREYFAFAMWYETGAITLRMLDVLSVSYVDDLLAGKTPYEIARDHFNLSTGELNTSLDAAKAEFGWSTIQTDAAKYANLK